MKTKPSPYIEEFQNKLSGKTELIEVKNLTQITKTSSKTKSIKICKTSDKKKKNK